MTFSLYFVVPFNCVALWIYQQVKLQYHLWLVYPCLVEYLMCITRDIISFYSLMVKCIFSSSLLMSGEIYIRMIWWICLYHCVRLMCCAGLVVKIRLRVINYVTIKKLMICFPLYFTCMQWNTCLLVSLSIDHY